jgi:hypothetical protein
MPDQEPTDIDRSGEQINWEFPRGDTWVLDFQFSVPTTGTATSGADLGDSSWLLQIRGEGGRKAVYSDARFTTAEITTGGQTTGYVVGIVQTTATTGASVGKKVYIYDIQQERNGFTATPCWGYITVKGDVSRADDS